MKCQLFSPQDCQFSRIIWETPDLKPFLLVSRFRVWNLPDNRGSLPFLVVSTFWHWNFKYFALFELFFTVNIERFLTNSSYNSNNIFFPHFFFHKWRHVLCIMTSSVIPSPLILNIWRHGGLTALSSAIGLTDQTRESDDRLPPELVIWEHVASKSWDL